MPARRIHDLDTPALLLNGGASDRNLRAAATFVGDKHARLRPHFKNHKCVTLARRQLATGNAVGITAAKLGEAEILVAGGIEDVLIANQVVGAIKVERLLRLAKKATVRVAVDSLDNARPIGEAAAKESLKIGVLLEVDVGMGRCGVPPGEPAVALAARIAELPGIRFDGIQSYEGHAIGIENRHDRQQVVKQSLGQAIDTRRQMEKQGIPFAILSGAGTSTYRFAASLEGVDELQIGSYATMDWYYAGLVDGEFEIALSILTTVISASPDRFVLDIGVKGAGDEMGPPKIANHPEFQIQSFRSEEHCTVLAPGHSLRVGDKLHLIPSHCCTTCNLHRQIHVHDGESILDVWPIEAAGALT
ncbi:MAG: DSD1 family PLP-dependent enzyme [Planctomycetota bacterium]